MDKSEELKEVTQYLRALQSRICASLQEADGGAAFRQDVWQQDNGSGRTHILNNGQVFEEAGVNGLAARKASSSGWNNCWASTLASYSGSSGAKLR